MDYFHHVFINFLKHQSFGAMDIVMEEQKSLRLHLKYIFCFKDGQKSCGFERHEGEYRSFLFWVKFDSTSSQ